MLVSEPSPSLGLEKDVGGFGAGLSAGALDVVSLIAELEDGETWVILTCFGSNTHTPRERAS